VLLIGFTLVISAINIYKRKRRAYHLVGALAMLSLIFHLTLWRNYEEALVSLGLFIILLLNSPWWSSSC
jgi:hypothetical protein